MTDKERAFDIARAALLEVGGDPDSIRPATGAGQVISVRPGDLVAYKAGVLAALAVYGPDKRIRCRRHLGADETCTTARYALIGLCDKEPAA